MFTLVLSYGVQLFKVFSKVHGARWLLKEICSNLPSLLNIFRTSVHVSCRLQKAFVPIRNGKYEFSRLLSGIAIYRFPAVVIAANSARSETVLMRPDFDETEPSLAFVPADDENWREPNRMWQWSGCGSSRAVSRVHVKTPLNLRRNAVLGSLSLSHNNCLTPRGTERCASVDDC